MDYDFKAGEVLLIDKPLEWTSFDVVKRIRNTISRTQKIKKIKVGHAGTLDPLASGLMIICTGKKTKEIQHFQDQKKEYIAQVKLGATTPSYDAETDEEQQFPVNHITKERALETLNSFLGAQLQIPPLFSARKVQGKRAYQHARKGNKVDMPPSDITIYEIELLKYDIPTLEIRVSCSKGTYIRSLAHDIGKRLDSGAYLTALERTKIGDFSLANAQSLTDFVELLEQNPATEQAD